jgi:prevent-host-death family protein
MSATITVEEAQAKLAELIRRLSPGEEIVVTQNREPVAKLVGQRPTARKSRVPGNCKGMITLAVEDDEHLKDFDHYLQWCAEDGRSPEKPFNGKIMVRIDPAIHRSLCQIAEIRSTSINSLAVEALAKLANDFESEIARGEHGRCLPSSTQKVQRRKGSARSTKSAGTAKKPGRSTKS